MREYNYSISSDLYHHGIKGMRWGVRRFQNKDGSLTDAGKKRYSDDGSELINIKSRNGDLLTLNRQKSPALTRFLANRGNTNAKKTIKAESSYLIEKDGKKIGNLELTKESRNSLNVNWVSISPKHNGKGYGTSVMKEVINLAKRNGYKQITLEVPGNSPNARHIYEKLGFKDQGSLTSDDDIWEGLTRMKLDL